MMRLLEVLITVCVLATFAFAAGNAGTTCNVPRDEMQVLVSYLKMSNRMTVLVTTTEASGVDVDYVNVRLALSGHGVPAEVRNDLKRKNRAECAIAPITDVPSLQFMTKNVHDKIFETPSGWAKFRKRFGKNARLESVSRVGFNSDHTIAMFYSSGGIGPMAGGCYLYVFRLRNGKWVKDSEQPGWNT